MKIYRGFSGADFLIVICQNCQKWAWEYGKKALSLQAAKEKQTRNDEQQDL